MPGMSRRGQACRFFPACRSIRRLLDSDGFRQRDKQKQDSNANREPVRPAEASAPPDTSEETGPSGSRLAIKDKPSTDPRRFSTVNKVVARPIAAGAILAKVAIGIAPPVCPRKKPTPVGGTWTLYLNQAWTIYGYIRCKRIPIFGAESADSINNRGRPRITLDRPRRVLIPAANIAIRHRLPRGSPLLPRIGRCSRSSRSAP
ncbi:hypothetical protein J2Z22_004541 [Paenibacillus forsythiae]|uniref:Uncharacterized protein n=1 Tax=Paenibacillus forsythiae TaxID=365616 RepID=A0ABU3HDX5_9BACL|nr:hypothetical protein [Paenibacillus forsythiae]